MGPLSQSEPGCNGNKGWLNTSQSFKSELETFHRKTFWGIPRIPLYFVVLPLYRECKERILKPSDNTIKCLFNVFCKDMASFFYVQHQFFWYIITILCHFCYLSGNFLIQFTFYRTFYLTQKWTIVNDLAAFRGKWIFFHPNNSVKIAISGNPKANYQLNTVNG